VQPCRKPATLGSRAGHLSADAIGSAPAFDLLPRSGPQSNGLLPEGVPAHPQPRGSSLYRRREGAEIAIHLAETRCNKHPFSPRF
jgi:hypothetical protein